MKRISLLLLSLVLFALSKDIQARPHLFNFDTIYAKADFCDRIEVINYDPELHLLSVKSNLDSLTYSFDVGYFNVKEFSNSKNEFLLIRGDGVVVIGILQGGKWVFNKMQSFAFGLCFVTTNNTVAQVENENGEVWSLWGKISYPKKYFKCKTPSATWSQERIEGNPFLYCRTNTSTILFDSINNRYFNDTIYVKKIMVSPKHITLMFNITRTIHTTQDCSEYLAAILNALGIPSEKILSGSEKATPESDYGEDLFSYSNTDYKLIVYTIYRSARNEDFSSLDIYLK